MNASTVRNFQIETFRDKEERNARYRELKAKHPNAVKFSGLEVVEGAGSILPNYTGRLELKKDGKVTRVIHGRIRQIFVSTWSVGWPILAGPQRQKARKFSAESCPPQRRRDERFAKRHGTKTREMIKILIRDRKLQRRRADKAS